jgi:hypothetical protein
MSRDKQKVDMQGPLYGAVATVIKRQGNKLALDAGEAARMNQMIQMLNCDPNGAAVLG